MGLNYRYLLYFKRDRLWDVLQDLAEICDTDGMSDWGKKSEAAHDQPEFKFATSIYFDEDPAILEYLHDRDGDEFDRSPPDENADRRYAIGFIYLTVYADLSKHYAFKQPTDMVLFEFNTTGTRMSMLFEESTSIRNTFVGLLGRFGGIIGILDREVDYGDLFWFKGVLYQPYQVSVLNVYTTPEEIEDMLKRGW